MQNIISQKIESLQKEINQLKALSKKHTSKKGIGDSLYGIFKGLKVSQQDFNAAKKSLFPYDRAGK